MILGTDEIKERIELGEIFRQGTASPSCLQEASYNLRVAWDGMVVNGKAYPVGKNYPHQTLAIAPGDVVVLSSMEHLNMPADIVGHLGVRLDVASQGLTALWGLQVDPHYGSNFEDEPLFFRFANFGEDSIEIEPGQSVANIEFDQVSGEVLVRNPGRGRTWDRVKGTRAQSFQAILRAQVQDVHHSLQPVVLFGVFLVAATLLGAVLSILVSLKDTPTRVMPTWVTGWGWTLIIVLIAMTALGVVALGLAGVCSVLRRPNNKRLLSLSKIFKEL